MTLLVVKALYFFLPAYFANMAPVVADACKLPFNQPISSRLFGEHKTYRGFIVGYFSAFLVLYIQYILFIQNNAVFSEISLLNYQNISIFLYAFIFGIGALTGDLIKSFFKRRIGKKPGSSWFPFDQIDFVVGVIIFSFFFYQIDGKIILVLLVVTPVLHLLINIFAFLLGLKKVWW
ncbi:MAG: CDP-archaeol synthase [Candidatus Parcubacteria bacterium]|nr:CDP-archaeol synthase [Candidatus Parcubacteria bacterium]